MRFSLINGERREAEKGIVGSCIGCGNEMIAKCGRVKIKHWAHKSKHKCDHWWENETEWHRTWKNNFPVECQENRFQDQNGEWHIADVRTSHGWVLEFQNSPISIEERESRNNFYKRIVWVVNGSRLRKDKALFFKCLEDGINVYGKSQVVKVFASESTLIQKWLNCQVPVFFDFGEENNLWCLYPTGLSNYCFLAPISHEEFIDWYQGKEIQLKRFIRFMQNFSEIISSYEIYLKRQKEINLRRTIFTPLVGFQRYSRARQRSRRRL